MRPSTAARFFGCGSGTSSGAAAAGAARTVVCRARQHRGRRPRSSGCVEPRRVHQRRAGLDRSAPGPRRRVPRHGAARAEVREPALGVTTTASANTASCSADSLARWKRSRPARAACPRRRRRPDSRSSRACARTFTIAASESGRSVGGEPHHAEHDDDADHRRGGGAEPGVHQMHVVEHRADAREQRRVVLRLRRG